MHIFLPSYLTRPILASRLSLLVLTRHLPVSSHPFPAPPSPPLLFSLPSPFLSRPRPNPSPSHSVRPLTPYPFDHHFIQTISSILPPLSAPSLSPSCTCIYSSHTVGNSTWRSTVILIFPCPMTFILLNHQVWFFYSYWNSTWRRPPSWMYTLLITSIALQLQSLNLNHFLQCLICDNLGNILQIYIQHGSWRPS